MARRAEVPPAGQQWVRNPATGEPLGAVVLTAPQTVAGLVAAARRVQPLWALLRVVDRAHYVRRLAQAVIDEFEELVELMAREQGRPPAEVATLELLPAIDALVWIADDGPAVLEGQRVGIHRSMFPVKQARVVREPYGVMAVIGAGSAPFALPLTQIAGALIAGNGVLFKPAPRAGLSGARIARLLARAALPEGLVAVVQGDAAVGRSVAESAVQKLLFTGSPPVAGEVAALGARDTREVVTETGGRDAMIVLADAHVARAAAGALGAGCAFAGQARGSVERVFVAREVSDRLTVELVREARSRRVGDPLAEGIQMGPLSNPRRRDRVHAMVQEAVSRGALLRCGGPFTPPGLSGAFYAPTVLTGVTAEMRVAREPIGGPVLAVTTVASAQEAIEQANAGTPGLGASVWTADRHRAGRIALELRAGMVWLNDHLASPAVSQGPWGSATGGGLGRTLGREGLLGCAREKLITWDPSGTRGLWWGPYDATLLRAAQSFAELRSARDSDRSRAWRRGGLAMTRLAARALDRRPPGG